MFSQEMKNRIKRLHGAQPLLAFLREQRLRARIRRALRSPLPESISIELTNECNLRCAKCPTYEAVRKRGMLAADLYEKILGDVRTAKAPTEIALSGGGEAILHSRVVQFIAMARAVSNVHTVGFATNGLGLSPELSRQLLEAGMNRLKVSLDTDDPSTYLRLNRVDGYEHVVQNVKTFCDLKRQGRFSCDVTLKITLYKEDEPLLERMRAIWLGDVDKIKVTGLHNWAGLRGGRTGLRRDPCDLIWSQIQILWDGQITLCCFDSMEGFYNMGNARDINISEYWQRSVALAEVRRAHLKRDFSGLQVCATCNQDQYITRYFHQAAP